MSGGYFFFWLGDDWARPSGTGSRPTDGAASVSTKGFDPARLNAVIEKHAGTVTLSFLSDLAPVLGLRLRIVAE